MCMKLQTLSNFMCTKTPNPAYSFSMDSRTGGLDACWWNCFVHWARKRTIGFRFGRLVDYCNHLQCFYVAFAVIMAVVSAVHSFLIVAYAGKDKVAKDVGLLRSPMLGGDSLVPCLVALYTSTLAEIGDYLYAFGQLLDFFSSRLHLALLCPHF